MNATRSWPAYQASYRTKEMKILGHWIQTNTSGAVVGLAGAGKSNLLGFLCNRPDALKSYIPSLDVPLAVIAVDLNNLPSNDLSTFYRVILRSFYEAADQFEDPLPDTIAILYRENRTSQDPFLSQSALRELLLHLQDRQIRVVLVLDRFDKFCREATTQMTDTLRGLRDSFKETLSYIVGMRQEVIYMSDPSVLGELYEILDTYVCWVGFMNESDARKLIAEETLTTSPPPIEADINRLLELTGNYPALLKTACHWWLNHGQEKTAANWLDTLFAERTIQYRLKEVWNGLSQEEQLTLSDVQRLARGSLKTTIKGNDKVFQHLQVQHQDALSRLIAKGVLQNSDGNLRISGELLAVYIRSVGGRSRGQLWLDKELNVIYQDQTPLDELAPLERSLLRFFLTYPRVRHTYTDLIEGAWPEEVYKEGVSTEALYQLVRGLRRQIEPNPSQFRYIINWRGKPEGGYQCFPEGRPG